MKVSAFKRARSWEVFDKLIPAFATLGLSPEEAMEAKRRYIAWQLAYDDCRERYLDGQRNIEWPPGTWAMVQFYGQVAAPS